MKEIDLSLDRVKEVLRRLSYSNQAYVITVAGTNGKGSTVKALEEIYRRAGYSVGAFTSPYLLRYNEQIRVNGVDCEDVTICDAFAVIKRHMGNIPLTPFEFGTLAALWIFKEHSLNMMILEVGLGGRLDAVNAIDTHLAMVTTIAIDHVEWLGSTREAIAHEKAGIFRSNRPAICGDFDPPKTIIQHAKELGAPLFCQDQHFGFRKNKKSWDWWFENHTLKNLPPSSLDLQNLSTVLMAVQLLQPIFPISRNIIDIVLKTVSLPGRLQVEGNQIFDVSHNPASVEKLSEYLLRNPVKGKTYAVFSMLKDKDILSTLEIIQKNIDHWYIAPLSVERGLSVDALQTIFQKSKIHCWKMYKTIREAYENILHAVTREDRIVIFGSFHTVAEIIQRG